MSTGELVITLIVAVVGLLSVWIPNRISLRNKQEIIDHLKAELNEQNQFRFDRILVDLGTMNVLQNQISKLFSITNADRFLIFLAYNGKSDVKYFNVAYEQHGNGIGITYSMGSTQGYNNDRDVDNIFRKMLKDVEFSGFVYLKTKDMEKGLLKDIYMEERISESRIGFVKRISVLDDKDLLVYTDISTHKEQGFTGNDKQAFNVRLHSIKKIIEQVIHGNK